MDWYTIISPSSLYCEDTLFCLFFCLGGLFVCLFLSNGRFRLWGLTIQEILAKEDPFSTPYKLQGLGDCLLPRHKAGSRSKETHMVSSCLPLKSPNLGLLLAFCNLDSITSTQITDGNHMFSIYMQ